MQANKYYSVQVSTVAVILESFNVCSNHNSEKCKVVRLRLVDGFLVEITATDGHVLSQICVEDEELRQLMEIQGVQVGYIGGLEIELLKTKLKYFKRNFKDHPFIQLETLFTNYKHSYPNVDKIKEDLDKSERSAIPICFNAEFIQRVARISKALGDGTRRPNALMLYMPKDRLSVIKLEAMPGQINCHSSEFYIMPIRGPNHVGVNTEVSNDQA